MTLLRDDVLRDLAEAEGLWPLVDIDSCTQCALPRQPQYAHYDVCYRCHEGWRRYGQTLDDLHPITYTTYDWTLGAGLRRLKDERCQADSDWAAGFGAVLSAYLELHLRQWGPFDCIVPVPTTAPVIVRSLERATAEGWWTPELRSVADLAPGAVRQRQRPNGEARADVAIDRWRVDSDALADARRVLVLDDMMSTGGSLFSFAKALRNHGVEYIVAVVAARNIGHDNASWLRPELEAALAGGRPWAPEQTKYDVLP